MSVSVAWFPDYGHIVAGIFSSGDNSDFKFTFSFVRLSLVVYKLQALTSVPAEASRILCRSRKMVLIIY